MSAQIDRKRLSDLVGLLGDELITDEQMAELDAMLVRSAEARELYRVSLGIHRDLDERRVKTSGGVEKHVSFLATAAMLAVAALVGFFLMGDNEDGAPPDSVAIVSDLVGVAWAEGQEPLSPSEAIRPGRVRLDSGIMRLQYPNGVVMALEGPADMDIVSRDHVFLQQGRIVTYVPESVKGFSVSTPMARFGEHDTEYGLVVNSEGWAELCVFDGEVSIRSVRERREAAERGVAGLGYQINEVGVSKSVGYRPSNFENARTVLRKQSIRDPFRAPDRLTANSDRSLGQPQYHLGTIHEAAAKRHKSWINLWAIGVRDVSLDESISGIVSDEDLVEATELVPGSTRYLSMEANAHPERPGSLSMSRSFQSVKQFRIDQHYTVEFLLRIDGDPSAIREIRASGLPGTDRETSTAIWRLRTTQVDGHPAWQIGNGAAMPLVRGRVYRFLVEVDPTGKRWRGSISDGQKAVYTNPIGPIPESTASASQQSTLRLDFDISPASNLRFSFDAVRIQNRPPEMNIRLAQ